MKLKLTYSRILELYGKTVILTSDCEMFPNFKVTGKILSEWTATNGETIIKFKLKNSNKIIDIGLNMKNLQFELVKYN